MNKNFYSIYKNGDKWIRIDGKGINPKNCQNIHWTSSPNASADLKYLLKFSFGYTHKGIIKFSDFKNNILIQIQRMAYIISLGYKYSESFMGDKIKKIELNLQDLNKREINVKGFRDKKGFWHKPHKRRIKDIIPKEKEHTYMTKNNVKEIITLNDFGIIGGMHDDNSYIIKFNNGSAGIYKIMKKGDIIGETSTYNISKILNWDIVPETISGNFGKGNGSCQKIINGVEPYAGYEVDNIKIYKKHFDNLAKIFVLDMILGNGDRHEANLIIDNANKCWAIDNEFIGMARASEKFMGALDLACGLSRKHNYNAMIIWLNKNLNRKDFLEFRKYVTKYIRESLDKKEEILNYYKQYNGSLKVGTMLMKEVRSNIKNNLEYMERIR